MEHLNITGNFQPSSVQSGSNLPHSRSLSHEATNSLVGGLKDIEKTQTTQVELVKASNPQRSDTERKDIENQIESLQQFNQSIDRTLRFKVDEELGVTIVRVIDKETDELIRQFPPEELLNLSRRLQSLNEQRVSNSGILLEEKV